MDSVICEETIGLNDKVCVDCKISKTPLWRSGPAGPKSLCNACGIRFRKRSDKKKVKSPPPRLASLPPLPEPSPTSSSSSSSSTNAGRTMSFRNREVDEDGGGEMKERKKLRIDVMAVGEEVVLLRRRRRRRRSPVRKVKRENVDKFGEEEEAAFVLMSLSCGLVFC